MCNDCCVFCFCFVVKIFSCGLDCWNWGNGYDWCCDGGCGLGLLIWSWFVVFFCDLGCIGWNDCNYFMWWCLFGCCICYCDCGLFFLYWLRIVFDFFVVWFFYFSVLWIFSFVCIGCLGVCCWWFFGLGVLVYGCCFVGYGYGWCVDWFIWFWVWFVCWVGIFFFVVFNLFRCFCLLVWVLLNWLVFLCIGVFCFVCFCRCIWCVCVFFKWYWWFVWGCVFVYFECFMGCWCYCSFCVFFVNNWCWLGGCFMNVIKFNNFWYV